ncbi:hypothetical protein ORD22_01760 [Sporosarcina sp. GW1-11]|uniref:hypothetical protein n=1 Tax=Sporosarcina sp. GW1-11 TaxID=2899126 RepID=UPI00294FE28B|nr:hypothetical protein [Sporosarcina sp. GW1-11]MDV6376988.1 hypothetical protein [Sporosarcina sp. GW1-11]
MIYINGDRIAEDIDNIAKTINEYLIREKMVLVDENNIPLNPSAIENLVIQNNAPQYLRAIHTTQLLREFKQELNGYIEKVNQYIDDIRDLDDQLSVINGYTSVVEAILSFIPITNFIQKDLINSDFLQSISEKVFERAQLNDMSFIIDVIEYELLPLLQNVSDEIQEVM